MSFLVCGEDIGSYEIYLVAKLSNSAVSRLPVSGCLALYPYKLWFYGVFKSEFKLSAVSFLSIV